MCSSFTSPFLLRAESPFLPPDPTATTALRPELGRYERDPDNLDYPEGAILFTEIPQPSLHSRIKDEGTSECVLTGWAKRRIVTAPGFPAPLDKPARACYVVLASTAKGYGVFATENIQVGQLVLAERPLIVAPTWSRADVSDNLTPEQHARAVRMTSRRAA